MRVRALAAVGLLAVLVGCPTEPREDDDDAVDDDDSATPDDDDDSATPDDDDSATPDDDDIVPDDDDTVPAVASIAGLVLDEGGAPLPGVDVSGLTTTGDDGRFEIEVDHGAHILGFAMEGRAPTWQRTEVDADLAHAVLQGMKATDTVQSFPVLAGVDLGAVAIDPAEVDAAGVAIAHVTTYDADDLLALPGTSQALPIHAAVQVQIVDEVGGPLPLVTGGALEVTLPLLDWSDIGAGEDLDAWRYDDSAGQWVLEGSGTTYAELDGSTSWLYYATRTGLFAATPGLDATGCVSGSVEAPLKPQIPHAWARASSEAAVVVGRADESGQFELTVPPGVEYSVDVVWFDDDGALGAALDEAAGTPVGGGPCADVGALDAPTTTCISGQVLDSGGVGTAGIEVVSSNGETATSGPGGSYCAAVPVLSQITMFGPVAAGEGGYLPWTVVTAPGDSECIGGCPNIALMRPYPVIHCASGTLLIDGAPSAGTIQIFDDYGPALPVYEMTTELDGTFCSEVPSGTSVFALSPELDCAPAAASTVGFSGSNCTAGGGCVNLGDILCSSSR